MMQFPLRGKAAFGSEMRTATRFPLSPVRQIFQLGTALCLVCAVSKGDRSKLKVFGDVSDLQRRPEDGSGELAESRSRYVRSSPRTEGA